MPRTSKITPELREIVTKEVQSIRIGAPFGVFDIRVFAAYDGHNLDDVPGAAIKAIIQKQAKMIGKNVIGQALWVRT